MTLLRDATIEALCSEDVDHPLISPFAKRRVKPASYDLTVGDEYYLFHKPHQESESRKLPVDRLESPGAAFTLYPNGVCFVITEERMHIPPNLAGSLSLPLHLLQRGLLMPRQPQIDPGFQGRLIAMLYNLSTSSIRFKRGDHLMSIEFHTLDDDAVEPYDKEEDAIYKNMNSISRVVTQPVVSSLFDFQDELKTLAKDLDNWQTRHASLNSWTLTILAVALAFFGIYQTVSNHSDRDDLDALETKVEALSEELSRIRDEIPADSEQTDDLIDNTPEDEGPSQ